MGQLFKLWHRNNCIIPADPSCPGEIMKLNSKASRRCVATPPFRFLCFCAISRRYFLTNIQAMFIVARRYSCIERVDENRVRKYRNILNRIALITYNANLIENYTSKYPSLLYNIYIYLFSFIIFFLVTQRTVRFFSIDNKRILLCRCKNHVVFCEIGIRGKNDFSAKC